MNLKDKYDGSNDPFEGDRTLYWHRLPSNAQILKATATVTAVDQSAGVNPYAEDIVFDGSGPDWGATKVALGAVPATPPPIASVEVDFHKRRTLASVIGTNTPGTGLPTANLQVELGGLYVEINQRGAVLSPPPDTKFSLPADGSLPGLTVSKFKLTQNAPSTGSQKYHMDVTKVTVRSAPSNVSLRLGKSATFWTHLGDFTGEETSSDFTSTLQTFLAKATVYAGYYVVPFVLHSDTIARLTVRLDIEYLSQVNALPAAVSEAVLPFDFSTVAKTDANLLAADLPGNARAVPGRTTTRLIGAFKETRIALGSVGAVKPVAAGDVSPVISQAQFFSPSIAVSPSTSVLPRAPIVVLGVDLFLAAQTPNVSLRLDIRGDADGKPDGVSLLSRVVDFNISSNAQKQPEWISVALPSAFRFDVRSTTDSTEGKYWLILQSLDGEALWSAEEAIPGSIPLQQTRDGALSWRDTSVVGTANPLAGVFRLRTQPDRFKMPIQLQVGPDGQVPRLQLDDFEPLGRVDFTVNTPSLAQTINNYVNTSRAQQGCEEVEYLANGNFEYWMADARPPDDPTFVERLKLDVGAVTVEPNGALAYVAISFGGSQATRTQVSLLQSVDTFCNQVLTAHPTGQFYLPIDPTPNTLVISPDGRRIYLALKTTLEGTLDLHSFDALTLRDLGHVTGTGGSKARPLAVSPNGKWMYWAAQDSNEIAVFDLATFNAAIDGQKPLPTPAKTLPVPGNGVPMAIDVAPDGSRIYVAVEKGAAAGPQIVTIDLATGNAVSPTILLPATPTGMAIASDGSTLWIVLPENGGVASVDLSTGRMAALEFGKGSLLEPFSPWDVAVTPQGTKLFLIGGSGIVAVQLGSVPSDWSRTLGYITPICVPGSNSGQEHIAALMGLIPSMQSGNAVATGLSQVAAVSGGCQVEFSFLAISSEPGALAEIFWLRADRTLLRADQLQIGTANLSDRQGFAGAISAGKISMELHRLKLAAPTAATQAEVRFSVPPGVLAAVGVVSMAATTESIGNEDFAILQNGVPANWTLSPALAPGLVLSRASDALELVNAGSETVELSQTVPVQSGLAYLFEFEGRVVPPMSGKTNPRIEVDWQKADGSSVDPSGNLEILPTSFSTQSAAWKAPSEAAQARIRLIVPPGATLESKSVSLRPSKLINVPLNFLAHAPGELRVSDAKITFDVVAAQALPVPTGGLATPTPPDQKPGDPSCDCCCATCGSKSQAKNVKSVVTPSGRAAKTGTCPSCGQVRVQLGGPVASGSRTLPSFRVRTPPAQAREELPQTVTGSSNSSIPALTSVEGIDQIRSRQLRWAGIASLEDLANATPKDVVRALRGVSVNTAVRYIESARSILSATSSRPRDGQSHRPTDPQDNREEQP
jgi:hypothetical protein